MRRRGRGQRGDEGAERRRPHLCGRVATRVMLMHKDGTDVGGAELSGSLSPPLLLLPRSPSASVHLQAAGEEKGMLLGAEQRAQIIVAAAKRSVGAASL